MGVRPVAATARGRRGGRPGAPRRPQACPQAVLRARGRPSDVGAAPSAPYTGRMPRPRRRPSNGRFTDRLVAAAPGEIVDALVRVDRRSAAYRAGVAARRAGEPREGWRPVAWLLGWDEAPTSG
jgi:hypothetical protein